MDGTYHETVHWSGHSSRLARTFGKRFGDKAYAFEELVAEIGAGLCCADLGLPNVLHDSHASYVGHWLGILRGDTTAIIHAAAKAEQAFAYLKKLHPNINAYARTGTAVPSRRAGDVAPGMPDRASSIPSAVGPPIAPAPTASPVRAVSAPARAVGCGARSP